MKYTALKSDPSFIVVLNIDARTSPRKEDILTIYIA